MFIFFKIQSIYVDIVVWLRQSLSVSLLLETSNTVLLEFIYFDTIPIIAQLLLYWFIWNFYRVLFSMIHAHPQIPVFENIKKMWKIFCFQTLFSEKTIFFQFQNYINFFFFRLIGELISSSLHSLLKLLFFQQISVLYFFMYFQKNLDNNL